MAPSAKKQPAFMPELTRRLHDFFWELFLEFRAQYPDKTRLKRALQKQLRLLVLKRDGVVMKNTNPLAGNATMCLLEQFFLEFDTLPGNMLMDLEAQDQQLLCIRHLLSGFSSINLTPLEVTMAALSDGGYWTLKRGDNKPTAPLQCSQFNWHVVRSGLDFYHGVFRVAYTVDGLAIVSEGEDELIVQVSGSKKGTVEIHRWERKEMGGNLD